MCGKCSGEKSKTEIFIEKARKVHGDRYDYSHSEYINLYTKLSINCPEHGRFLQSPMHHISGHGCKSCGVEKIAEKSRGCSLEFIEKARVVHLDRYDYSEVAYITSKTKVKIICRIHGGFLQRASQHLSGGGCPECAGSRILDRDGFIAKAKKVHGDRYDYALVRWRSQDSVVRIRCPQHGVFNKKARLHIAGYGCSKCVAESSLAEKQSRLISKAVEVHGGEYDYSRVKYVSMNVKTEIICKRHGVFWQKLGNHAKGYKCRECAGNAPIDEEMFIERASAIHGGRYLYCDTKFSGSERIVKIHCKKHGQFSQKMKLHLMGHGCPKCGGKSKLSTKEFICKAKRIHFRKFDYSRVMYVNTKTKVEIVCRRHGVFLQNPMTHLAGSGCPKCSDSKGESKVKAILSRKKVRFKEQMVLCHRGVRLRCDAFCLSKRVIFEYDGQWHYKPHWKSGIDGLETQRRNDRLKNSWAKANGYRMVRIPYWAYDKIEEIVEAALRGDKPKIPRRPRVGKTGSSGKKRSRSGRKSCV